MAGYVRRQEFDLKRKISSKCLQKIQSLPLPGNARELKNILKKTVVMGEGDILQDLDSAVTHALPLSHEPYPDIPPSCHDDFDFKGRLLSCEKQLLVQALERHDTTRALARLLHLSQSSVVRKLKIHGLSHRLKRNAGQRR